MTSRGGSVGAGSTPKPNVSNGEHLSTSAPVVDEKAPAPQQDEHDLTSPDASKTTVEAPDGGAQAWLVVLGAWCTSFCSFGWINSVGVFQEYYQTELLPGYSASTISWIPSLQIFFMMGMGPIVGVLYDKFGPRHLLMVGTFLHVFGLMMASLSVQYHQVLLSQGVCSAIGVAAIFQPALNTISGWFNKRRGAAFGILATGSSLGGVIFPIMVSRLIAQVGYGWAMRVSAFLILVLLLIAIATVKPFQQPKPGILSIRRFYLPFTDVKFLALTVGLLFFTFGLYIPMDYIPVEAAAAGMSQHLVEYLVPMLNAASLFGRAGSGFVADKVGCYNIFIVVCYLTGIWILALWIPAATTGARIAFSTIFGFFSGVYVALIPALVVQISPLSEIGFRTGLVFFACSFGGLTTNPISGVILDQGSGWVGAKIFAGVFCLVGTCFVLVARMHHTGMHLRSVF
ncbi:Major facilitator superfamily domain, general substrate transporter [Metarhizium rileyi]|uniref:Major facilitator superfamily domain, general substrate transporter n=1 Tax=Metarhizium rileyi (strain RCEF 4871) TaxID=1649241 RepID=A0A166S7C7_METRR|nr:Major facilitator superfamily domain, general substrate transporter [Metarhizium rileyi RCEF 4871]